MPMQHTESSVEATPIADDRDLQDLFRDIDRSGVLPAHVPAYQAADAVLCALEMRLPRRQADEIVHDVPPTLSLLVRRCVIHKTDKPELSFDEPAFLRLIASALRISVAEAERVTRAVFVAVQKRLPEEEILEVRRRLPSELNALWLKLESPPAEDTGAVARGRPVEEPTETILREIEQSGVLPEGRSATTALQAVLCTLSLELTGHEAQELADSSTTLHRLLSSCVSHRDERPEVMRRQTFLHRLAEHLGVDDKRAERVARTVFAAVRGRLPPNEVAKIDGRLPRSVRSLWVL
jgi:uncharacterized protein (DUF2267 family)